MTVFFVCFNLAEPLNIQRSRISYWLDFLNSSLPLPHNQSTASNLLPTCKIVLIGTKSDLQKEFALTSTPQLIGSMISQWSRLPITPAIFTVSSHTSVKSVQLLLDYVEQECNNIFSQFSVKLPKSYRKILSQLKERPAIKSILHWTDLFKEFSWEFDRPGFQTMLKYFESIGRIIWLPGGLVFTDPSIASKIVAKFVSPKDIRLLLFKQDNEYVQILEMSDIGSLLQVNIRSNNLEQQIALMVHLNICYELHQAESDTIHYMFPSLSIKASMYFHAEEH